MGFDFAVIALLLPSHCGFSFVCRCGVSFLVSSSVFLSMIVQQLSSCDSGVLIRGNESTSFYSVILFQAPLCPADGFKVGSCDLKTSDRGLPWWHSG